MATIVVEDGTGKTDSNSYINEAGLTTYATDRGITLTAADDAAKAALLIRAMDYIEQQPFKGTKNTEAQALQWPRSGVYIDSYYVDSDEIPQLLIDALCEVAIANDGGTDVLANEERATKREKVDVIEVEYMDGARNTVYVKAAETKLSKLLKAGSGGISAVTIRG